MTTRGQDRVVLSSADSDKAHLTEVLWGTPPAAMIEEGLKRLIGRMYSELHRHPTVAEIDEQTYSSAPAPEIAEAITNAARVFRDDIGREPTPFELQAGLNLADTRAALYTYLELEIQVGDRVMWAETDDFGERLHQTINGRDDQIVPVYGTVVGQAQGWTGDQKVERDDGRTVSIARKWLIRVRSLIRGPTSARLVGEGQPFAAVEIARQPAWSTCSADQSNCGASTTGQSCAQRS